jgi:hypothetical protein
MARNFLAASTQYFSLGPLFTATPFSLAAWVRPTDLSNAPNVFSFSDGASDGFRMGLGTTGNLSAITSSAGNGIATITSVVVVGRWSHVCAVYTSPTSRAAYHNGGSKATNATSKTPAGINVGYLGMGFSVGTAGMNGLIVQPWFFPYALDDGEVVALARGTPPWTIRPWLQSTGWLFDRTLGSEYAYACPRICQAVPVNGPTGADDPPWIMNPLTQRRPWLGARVAAAAGMTGPLIGGRLVNTHALIGGRLVAV